MQRSTFALALMLIACSSSREEPSLENDVASDEGDASAAPALPNARLDAPPPHCPALASDDASECASDDDCSAQRPRCALSDDCTGLCVTGDVQDLCFRNADCDDGLSCASIAIDGDLPGHCRRNGTLATPCTAQSDCTAPLRCVHLSDTLWQCTDGAEGSPCGRHESCESQRCVQQQCSSGALSAVCDSDDDCAEGYCGLHSDSGEPERFACMNGERGDSCTEDAQCLSGACVTDTGMDWGKCEPGETAQPCFTDADCASGACVGGSTGVLGACGGNLGAQCDASAPCGTGFCVETNPGRGTCESGEGGAPCLANDDCLSGFCELQPNRAMAGSCAM